MRRSTNEKNRRRDLVNALRTRREAMLQALKRDQHSANRHVPLPAHIAVCLLPNAPGTYSPFLNTADSLYSSPYMPM